MTEDSSIYISVIGVIIAILSSVRLARLDREKEKDKSVNDHIKIGERLVKLESDDLSMRKILDSLVTNMTSEIKELGERQNEINNKLFIGDIFVQRNEFAQLIRTVEQNYINIYNEISELRTFLMKK